jgi:hypothetical protein
MITGESLGIEVFAEELAMSHIPFNFPLQLNSDNDAFVVGTYGEYQFSKSGMTYLLYRLGDYVDRKYAYDLWKANMYVDLVFYINSCRTMQESEELWRKGRTLVLATNKRHIFGVMTNYNPKYNSNVIEDLHDSGLINNLKWWSITPLEMNLYLEYKKENGVSFGLNIRNGETGHATYGYRIYFKSEDYVFHENFNKTAKRRHLSKLDILDMTMQDMYAELQDLIIFDRMQESACSDYAKLILTDNDFAKIHSLVEPYDSLIINLHKLISALSEQSKQRGYKVLCTKALDLIYKELSHAV